MLVERAGHGARWIGALVGARWVALLLALATRSSGAATGEFQARMAAVNWLARSAVVRHRETKGRNYAVDAVTSLKDSDDTTLAYHVSLDPRGCIIVSGDQRIRPVPFFSLESAFSPGEPERSLLRSIVEADLKVCRRILSCPRQVNGDGELSGLQRSAIARNRAEWSELLSPRPRPSAADLNGTTPSKVLVTPLLDTTWSQWNHYNELCPTNVSALPGYDGRAPAGCVAVSAAELANYHEWPPYGMGACTDRDARLENGITGVYHAVFSDPFDWAGMQTNYNPWGAEPADAVAAVAEVMYEFGVLAETDYGTNVSLAVADGIGRGLASHCFFTQGELCNRDGQEAAFDSRLRQAVLNMEPVVAAVLEHTVVADGLAEEAGNDYFHVAAGWGGQQNGWYRLSDLNGDSVSKAIFDLGPELIPLLSDRSPATVVSNRFGLAWQIPKRRTSDVARICLEEGIWRRTNFVDTADHFTNWLNVAAWCIDAAGTGGGSCFRKESGELGVAHLSLFESFTTRSGTMSFAYRTDLTNDRACVEVSNDDGLTWDVVAELADNWASPWPWDTQTIHFSSYSNQELLVRFCYVLTNDFFYTGGGVWIDDVRIEDVEFRDWSVVDDNIDAATRSYVVSGRMDNVYSYAVRANDGTHWLRRSPPKSVVVFHPECDRDGDGLLNGWESTFFRCPTGAVASADADGDGMDNGAEQYAGTHPCCSTSVLRAWFDSAPPGGTSVAWTSVAGKQYSVWRAAGLDGEMPFHRITNGLTATPGTNTFLDKDAAGMQQVLYRIHVD